MKQIKQTKQESIQACISKQDLYQLQELIKHAKHESLEQLSAKLQTMQLVDGDGAQPQNVGLNQDVTLLDAHTNRVMQMRLVLPEESDIKQKKISVLTPIGIALLGECKGDRVIWPIGGGFREVTIMDIGG